MSPTPLARIAAPIAIVAGALVIATRLIIMLTIPADLGALQAAVVTPIFAI